MGSEKYLTYRGKIRSIAGFNSELFFVTEQTEFKESQLYFLDVEKAKLTSHDLPTGGRTVLCDKNTNIWVCGSNNRVYLSEKKGKPKDTGILLDSNAVGITLLSDNRVGILTQTEIKILDSKGKVLKTIEFQDIAEGGQGSCIASDPSGNFLTIGTTTGFCIVYECEGKDDFELSESAKIHNGAVSTILYEKEEIAFISAGSDQKVFVTHARGKLEPIERSAEVHEGKITSSLMGIERFYTAGFDKTIKAWAKTGKPATLKDDVGKVVDLAMISIDSHDHIAAASTDNTIRIFSIDEAGRLNDLKTKFFDAYKSAKRDLAQEKAADRLNTIKTLASYDDFEALKLINGHIEKESDPDAKLKCINYLAASKHDKADTFLYDFLNHDDSKIRIAAFNGLIKLKGKEHIVTIDKALASKRADVGVEAVKILESLALKNDQLIVKLFGALQINPYAVRVQALYSLENIYGNRSIDASLKALQSKFEDIRKLALIRIYKRGFLERIEAIAAIHKHCEDESLDVRKIAFYLLIMTRKNLADQLRFKDQNVHRMIYDIETFGQKDTDKLPEPRKSKTELNQDDYEPLLFAMACRVTDTCLEGARLLAVLKDTRAFGLLLQLSREDDVDTRVSVCQAFLSLNDKRSVRHLLIMLEDQAGEVRDAAFSALKGLYSEPLSLVTDAFKSLFNDVRQRALQVLIYEIRNGENNTEKAHGLLLSALNDIDGDLRSEAFKSCLNLKIKGGNEKTLHFINQSRQMDVRNEVLNEVKASEKEPWAEEILFSFFSDTDQTLRNEAFEYSLKRKKGKETDALKAAIKADYVDIRLKAVEHLLKIEGEKIVDILAPALNDKNYKVRKSVIDALVRINEKETLIKALSSSFYDVRALAAKARAAFGDKEVFEPLKELLSIEEPKGSDEEIKDPQIKSEISHKEWKKLITLALKGFGELGDDNAIDIIAPFLKNEDKEIKTEAVKALSLICSDRSRELLLSALKDEDNDVKINASIGLAYLGDESVTPVIFSGTLDQTTSMKAAFMLGCDLDSRVYTFLESSDDSVRRTIYLALMMLEIESGSTFPEKLITCLSARDESIRFSTAKALKMYPEEFGNFVTDLFNDKGEKPAFKVPFEDISISARILAFGERLTKLHILNLLFLLCEKKQHNWDRAFEIFKYRFKDQIEKIPETKSTLKISETEKSELLNLSFGSFVGLVREQGGYHKSQRTTPGNVVIRIRQKALNELLKMGEKDKYFFEALKPVFLQTLRDPISDVRTRAFTLLKEAEIDTAVLGAESLGAGFMDIGREGLKLLTEKGSPKDKVKILEQTMLSRDDGLELEAAKILVEANGKISTSKRAFESVSVKLQRTCVGWLSDLYEQEREARDILLSGLGTRFREIYFKIAFLLATKKDKDAFKYLKMLLNDHQNESELERVVQKMVELNAPETMDALISKAKEDFNGEYDRIIFGAVGKLRDDSRLDDLLNFLNRRKNKNYVFNAILAISGFDQRILDYNDENVDKSWEKKQFPRKTEILAKLLSASVSLNETGSVLKLIDGARWARASVIDSHLSKLINYPDDKIKEKTISALSFRLKKRDGSKDALVRTLESKDTNFRFLAAEGLALAGHSEGISILLAGVELLEDFSFRKRAVKALGVTKDPRAIDILLKLANDTEHALSEEAIEAIGHLGKTDSRDEVFILLSKLVQGNDGISEKAVRGLRWFNTEDGWKLIRQKAVSEDYYYRETAVEMLAYNDDKYTKDILLDLIKNENNQYMVEKSVESAEKLFGQDSLEPDYAAVQAKARWFTVDRHLKRISENGDPEKVLAILHNCRENTHISLTEILLSLKPAPLEAAFNTLSSNMEDSVAVAAQILGRVKDINPDYSESIVNAATRFLDKWKRVRSDLASKKAEEKELDSISKCLAKLMWLSGRYGVALKTIIEAASFSYDPYFKEVQLAAVTALSEFKTGEAKEALETALTSGNAEIRTIAAQALNGRSKNIKEIISDRTGFIRAYEEDENYQIVAEAASKAEFQGVVLPLLIRKRDIEGLNSIMKNSDLDDEVRLGAVESLARLKDEKAEARLSDFAGENIDEDIKKAVFKALRRSKRARQSA